MIEFDAVIIGGGINGLTAAAYLAKSGLAVAVVERRDQLGTHCVTEEHSLPGWRISPHATFMWVGNSPCMLDLELERFGLNLIAPRFSKAHTFRDGKSLVPDEYDANNTYKKIRKFSEKDAKTFKDIVNSIASVRGELISRFIYSPPSPENWDYAMKAFGTIPRIPEDFFDMTGFELLEYLYESDYLKAHLAGWSGAVGYPPHVRLSGPIGVILMNTTSAGQQVIGGAHQLPHALFRCIVHHGGKILQSCDVKKIRIENGEARSVILTDQSSYPEKEIVARKAVISDLSPGPTFLELVGEEHIDRAAARVIKSWDYWHALFTACYLTTDTPRWTGSNYDPDMQEAWSYNLGADSLEEVEDMFSDLLAGRIPEPIKLLGNDFTLSLYDSTAAPPGMHNVQIWADVPYRLAKSGNADAWDDIKDDILSQITQVVESYAPNFHRTVKASCSLTPLDTYRKNPSAIKGSTHAGSLMPGQFYFDRPFLGCNAPRTPVKKLYLSNGCWPLGITTLATGYNCATVIMQDVLGSKPDWWKHRPFDWYLAWTQLKGIHFNNKVTVD